MKVFTKAGSWLYNGRRRLATGGVAVLACLMAYHVVFGANGMMVYQHKRAEYRKLEQDMEQLRRENERLAGRIKALKSDPAAVEKEAREQLRYARPGEKVYVLPEAQRPAPTPQTARNR